ncbi:septal ring lytic transglycosylase RlpA family protein [Tardiphaga robiniae]|uniref:septal ring lytic transglycosylase RlpA family protein n=1 Tax=Tardiphaga robiniae TaxID=943830 RepID=UPI001FCD086C|nr:septal ring lytic transglycosylase RlpA family protein [Tardiphaga robiniae]
MIRLFSACVLLCAFFNSPAFAQNFLEGVVSIGVKLTKEETCVASQYGVGDGYHGRRTASGERFNAYALMAAHKSRRFGSHVTVTNKNNGRSVRVRITDRPVYRGAASTRLEQQPTQSAWAGSRA